MEIPTMPETTPDNNPQEREQEQGETGPVRHSLKTQFAVAAIKFYRRHLSHRKNYKCANGAMGGRTCSTQGLENFLTLSFRDACRETAKYLRQCGQMAKIYRIAVNDDEAVAVQKITQKFGKTEDKARQLVAKAHAYKACENDGPN